MNKWKYKVMDILGEITDLEECLNDNGDNGWELLSATVAVNGTTRLFFGQIVEEKRKSIVKDRS